MKAYRVLGTTDDVTACDLCGREELKRTVVLQPLDADGGADGEPVFFGTDCAARAAGWSQKEVRTQAGAADRAREQAQQQRRDRISYGITCDPARLAAWRAYEARWDREQLERRDHVGFNERRTWPEHVALMAAELAALERLEASEPQVPELPRKASPARGQLEMVASL